MSADPRFALDRANAAVLVIDMQERLAAAMPAEDLQRAVRYTRALLETADALGLPVIATEQYPRGLGPTLGEIREKLREPPVEKVQFSCGAVKEVAEKLWQSGRKQVLVAGMEAHVCVFQTVRDLQAGEYFPFVLSDAVTSRAGYNRDIGLDLMRRLGATVTSTETALFDLLGQAGTPEFKRISALLK
jgi:nicotinamidase-related amidase